MSEDSKKSILERESTRREFLKLTGKTIGGTILSFSILNLFGCAPAEEAAAFALPEALLIADRSLCTGCQRCELTCSAIHDNKVQPYISKIKVSRNYNYGLDGPKLSYEREDGQFGNLLMNVETCKQCREPFCGHACPQGAIFFDKKNKGARVVNKSKCVGCGSCSNACPWNLPTVDPESHTASKCKLCGVCATGCPTGALRLIPWEDVKIAMRKHGFIAG